MPIIIDPSSAHGTGWETFVAIGVAVLIVLGYLFLCLWIERR